MLVVPLAPLTPQLCCGRAHGRPATKFLKLVGGLLEPKRAYNPSDDEIPWTKLEEASPYNKLLHEKLEVDTQVAGLSIAVTGVPCAEHRDRRLRFEPKYPRRRHKGQQAVPAQVTPLRRR